MVLVRGGMRERGSWSRLEVDIGEVRLLNLGKRWRRDGGEVG